jgi:hypothetical protein
MWVLLTSHQRQTLLTAACEPAYRVTNKHSHTHTWTEHSKKRCLVAAWTMTLSCREWYYRRAYVVHERICMHGKVLICLIASHCSNRHSPDWLLLRVRQASHRRAHRQSCPSGTGTVSIWWHATVISMTETDDRCCQRSTLEAHYRPITFVGCDRMCAYKPTNPLVCTRNLWTIAHSWQMCELKSATN